METINYYIIFIVYTRARARNEVFLNSIYNCLIYCIDGVVADGGERERDSMARLWHGAHQQR